MLSFLSVFRFLLPKSGLSVDAEQEHKQWNDDGVFLQGKQNEAPNLAY